MQQERVKVGELRSWLADRIATWKRPERKS
jgi:hypothetical protein